jgi:hypothetical protein
MIIKHKAMFNRFDGEELFSYIFKNNLNYKTSSRSSGNDLIFFTFNEDIANWEEIERMVKAAKSVETKDTFFSDEELLQCDWARLWVMNEKDYHIHTLDSSWRLNYFKDLCFACGSYVRQDRPYMIGSNSKLTKDFISFGGTLDFATDQFHIDEMRKAGLTGFEVWSLIRKKDRSIFDGLKQIYIPGRTIENGYVDNNEKKPVICQKCGAKKYSYHNYGWMEIQAEALIGAPDFVQTFEMFGDGGLAFREILISKKAIHFFIEQKWKNIKLKGVKLVKIFCSCSYFSNPSKLSPYSEPSVIATEQGNDSVF